MGGQLFGRLPKDGQREFFCLDAKTWVWHEAWIDQATRTHHQATLRYDIRTSFVYKKQDNASDWQPVGAVEKARLEAAIELYRSRVLGKLYPRRDWSRF